MRIGEQCRRLMVFIGEDDAYGHHSLASEIVHRAQQAALAGATVVRGIEGFGATNHLHTTHILSLSNDLPIVIILVDDAERIDSFLPVLDELVTGGLVTIDDVVVFKYVAEQDA